ncbi:MAG: hypothetical protein H0T84_10220 [Tatlockia sp.]|nr:hypothetical protein [Tatlockia sp.]
MNAITKGHKILGTLLFAVGLLFAASSSAHWNHGRWHHGWGGWGGGVYVGPSFYPAPNYRNCGWVGGHWRHGYWVPAHRVCWY